MFSLAKVGIIFYLPNFLATFLKKFFRAIFPGLTRAYIYYRIFFTPEKSPFIRLHFLRKIFPKLFGSVV